MTALYIGSIRTRGGYRPPVTVRAESKDEARHYLSARYPCDRIEAVLPARYWPPCSDTGRDRGDIREHHG
ncbi:hypothetical protein [Methylobacterium oryzihabitans]|jgi:hypothetical protein|uniref:Uncharacterized protein n=1 Tax=Methylobacterium oryzihabitans TaxID=2499852 RepID=A0A3S2W960_9HYPH|nr:hypothetical protein [Methylobacterium oryzihabitans]RVU16834.1 hypothetical protein EOE48_15315 [Methylobacterium oryzihabitans]